MANVKITELTSSTSLTPDDVIPVVDTTAAGTRQVTKNAFFKVMAGDVMADDSYDGPAIAGLNAGSFTTGTAYLFVVDANGNASAGKEITLGNTYGSAKVMGVSTGSLTKIDGVAIASINKIFGYDF